MHGTHAVTTCMTALFISIHVPMLVCVHAILSLHLRSCNVPRVHPVSRRCVIVFPMA